MTSPFVKKSLTVLFSVLLACQSAYATPWAEKQSYGEKISGKFLFGLRNSLLGWTEIFTEPWDSKYDLKKSEWEGFCDGIAQSVLYTANGLIHLVTFPIPVDFPNMGAGTLPDLGKKGTPKPWEVHGRSEYRVVPAEQVIQPVKSAPPAKTEMEIPPPAQTPAAYANSYQTVPPMPVVSAAVPMSRTVTVSQPLTPPQPAAAEAADISSRIK